MNSTQAILDALTSQQQRGETSLIVTIQLDLIQDVMNALRDYRKMFAPLVPGVTDTAQVYATYEKMRAHAITHTVLLFVECRNTEEFDEALSRLPIRHSSEWRSLDSGQSDFVL